MAGVIFPQGRNKSYFGNKNSDKDIFKKYFLKNSKDISQKEEKYLLKLLKRRVSRWFVPHYLRELNTFSESLMKALVDEGIKVIDPSYNECFILPAKKVYGLNVDDYIIQRFSKSSLNEKRGIFRLLYWMQLDQNSKEYEERISFFLKEYRETNNKKLKHYIAIYLPDKLSKFPASLKGVANKYLEHRETK